MTQTPEPWTKGVSGSQWHVPRMHPSQAINSRKQFPLRCARCRGAGVEAERHRSVRDRALLRASLRVPPSGPPFPKPRNSGATPLPLPTFRPSPPSFQATFICLGPCCQLSLWYNCAEPASQSFATLGASTGTKEVPFCSPTGVTGSALPVAITLVLSDRSGAV